MLNEFWDQLVDVTFDMAPWLLMGLIAAGLVKALIPENFVMRWLGGRGMGPITRGALVGVPLPLCSCSVIPMALGLHRNGASKSSTVSFLVATPETGVDSIALSWVMLGPFMTIARPISAVFSAVFSGVLTMVAEVYDGKALSKSKTKSDASNKTETTGCCSGKTESYQQPGFLKTASEVKINAETQSSCCSSKVEEQNEPAPIAEGSNSCCSSKVETELKPEKITEMQSSCCSSKAEETPVPVSEVQSSCCSSNTEVKEKPILSAEVQSSCCSSQTVASEIKNSVSETKKVENSETDSACTTSCCSSSAPSDESLSGWKKVQNGVMYSMTSLWDDIAPWLMGGILLTALVKTLFPEGSFEVFSDYKLLSMLALVAASIPVYVCATASTPMAAAMLFSGMSPGTVLAFLIAGPGTNIAPLALIRKEMGWRTTVAYVSGILISAVTIGLTTDWILTETQWIPAVSMDVLEHSENPLWLALGSTLILIGFAIRKQFKFKKWAFAQ